MGLFDSGIRPAIDEHLLKLAAQERDYGDYWSASSAGYCMRKNIFERLKVPHSTPDDPRKQRVFTSGHIFHEWIQGLTKEAGISIAQEVELQDEGLMIRGHFDDLVLVKSSTIVGETKVDGYHVSGTASREADRLILYDYKTVNSRSFTYAKQNGNAMSHFHRLQLGTYMYILRKLAKKISELIERPDLYELILNLLEARILKISKDDLRMDEQQLLWTPDLEKEVVSYWRTLNGYWESKKLPKCTCADYEGGFMAREKFNPFYFQDEPCSLEWYKLQKKEGKVEAL